MNPYTRLILTKNIQVSKKVYLQVDRLVVTNFSFIEEINNIHPEYETPFSTLWYIRTYIHRPFQNFIGEVHNV